MKEQEATNYLDDNEDVDQTKLPTGLNVLTILTFIWSAISVIANLYSFSTAKKSYDTKDEVLAKMNSTEMPGFLKSIMPSPQNFEAMVTKSYENRIPILILGLLAVGLCFWGALEMRKRKKQGFTFYLVGTFLPFITSAAFIGFFALTGGAVYFMIFISLLFVGLYAMQRKYLYK